MEPNERTLNEILVMIQTLTSRLNLAEGKLNVMEQALGEEELEEDRIEKEELAAAAAAPASEVQEKEEGLDHISLQVIEDELIELRPHCPEGMQISVFFGAFPQAEQGEHGLSAKRHEVEDVLARIKERPHTWKHTSLDSWLVRKSFREEEVGIPELMQEIQGEPVPEGFKFDYAKLYPGPACSKCQGEGTLFDKESYQVSFCGECRKIPLQL